MNFFWLVFAHFLGDISLQNDWMTEFKGRYWYVMQSHCIIWAGCIAVVLQYLGILTLWKIHFLIIGHYLMDSWKCKKNRSVKTWWYVYPDQAWHLIQCVIVYYF